MQKKKRRNITLIEIVIVMFLIAMITGVIAYNYTGTLEKGKAFKTEMGIERLTTVLNLSAAEHPTLLDNIEGKWKEVVRSSPLVNKPDELIHDGWGYEYRVNVDNSGNIEVSSAKLDEYKKNH